MNDPNEVYQSFRFIIINDIVILFLSVASINLLISFASKIMSGLKNFMILNCLTRNA